MQHYRKSQTYHHPGPHVFEQYLYIGSPLFVCFSFFQEQGTPHQTEQVTRSGPPSCLGLHPHVRALKHILRRKSQIKPPKRSYFQKASRKVASVHCRSNNQLPPHSAQELSSLTVLNQRPWTFRHLDGVEAHCFCDGCLPPCHCIHGSNLVKPLSMALKRPHLQQRQSVRCVSAGTAALELVICYCGHT